jgi:hypothetical protein
MQPKVVGGAHRASVAQLLMDPVRLFVTAHPTEVIFADDAEHLRTALVFFDQRQTIGTIGRVWVSTFICQPLFDTRLGRARPVRVKNLTALFARGSLAQVAGDKFIIAPLPEVENIFTACFGAKH